MTEWQKSWEGGELTRMGRRLKPVLKKYRKRQNRRAGKLMDSQTRPLVGWYMWFK